MPNLHPTLSDPSPASNTATASNSSHNNQESNNESTPSQNGCSLAGLITGAVIASTLWFVLGGKCQTNPQDNRPSIPESTPSQQSLEQRDILIEVKIGDSYVPISAYIGGGWEDIRKSPIENPTYILKARGYRIEFENQQAHAIFRDAFTQSERNDALSRRLKFKTVSGIELHINEYEAKDARTIAEKISRLEGNSKQISEKEARTFEIITETPQPDGYGGGRQQIITYTPQTQTSTR